MANAKNAAKPKTEAHDEISARPGAAVVTEQKVATVQRVPGAPILYEDDAKNLEQVEAERADHVATEVPAYPLSVPTTDPAANGEARNNIVPDGAGTYGEVGLTVGPL